MKSPVTSVYIILFILSTIGLTMCKNDVKSSTDPSDSPDKAISITTHIDSSQVNFDQMEEFHFVSIPRLYSWNRMGQSLIQLNKNPDGYAITDTISWIYPSGKSFMSMSHAEATSDSVDVDYKMFYERIRLSYPYEEYSYNKYDVNGVIMYEIKLSNDSIRTYKLVIPNGREIVQIDVLSHAKDYNEEISQSLDQLPGLVRIKR